MPAWVDSSEGSPLAVAAESLFLVNLLLAPGIGFIALVGLWLWSRKRASPLAAAHLAQTLSGSLWAGFLLVILNALILMLGGYDGAYVWAIVITYFVVCHAMLVLCGAYGLAKAMAGQCWRYPLIGRPLPKGC